MMVIVIMMILLTTMLVIFYDNLAHDNDNDDNDNRQEKISISAGGALAFDTVNLLINTFSSLVRWPIVTIMRMTMKIMTMVTIRGRPYITSYDFGVSGESPPYVIL